MKRLFKSKGRARLAQRRGLYRPQCMALEDRLPPGDVWLGGWLAGSLLGLGLLTLDPGLAAGEMGTEDVPARQRALPHVSWEVLETEEAPAAFASLSLGENTMQANAAPATQARRDGPQLQGWVQTIPGVGLDRANAVAINANGDVADAGPVWEQTIPGFGDGRDVAIDANGDVVSVGIHAPDGSDDAGWLVVKQGRDDGSIQWQRTLFPDSGGRALKVAINGVGDIAVVGRSPADFTVVKLEGTTGTPLWQRVLFGTSTDGGIAAAVVFHPCGDVIAAGRVSNTEGGGDDMFVVRLSGADGQEVWRRSIDGTRNMNDAASALQLDATGKVIVAGITRNEGTALIDGTVAKLDDADGSIIWQTNIVGSRPGGQDSANSVVVDAADDVFVAGVTDNFFTQQDTTVTKLAGATGAELWRTTLNGSRDRDDSPGTLALDGAGDVVVACSTNNEDTGADATVAKLTNGDGSVVWRRDLAGTSTTPFAVDYASGVAIDGAGDVVAVGSFWNSGTGTDFSVVKLAGADGQELWRRDEHLGGADSAAAVALDALGDVAACGKLMTPGGELRFTTMKFRGGG